MRKVLASAILVIAIIQSAPASGDEARAATDAAAPQCFDARTGLDVPCGHVNDTDPYFPKGHECYHPAAGGRSWYYGSCSVQAFGDGFPHDLTRQEQCEKARGGRFDWRNGTCSK